MNVKIILGAIIAVSGVYYGAQWLQHRNDISTQLQEVPYIQENVGHMLDFSMEKSKDAPMCGDYCNGVSRYLFTMKGDKATMQLAADYNKVLRDFSHRIYCDENGKPLVMDKDMTVLVCR